MPQQILQCKSLLLEMNPGKNPGKLKQEKYGYDCQCYIKNVFRLWIRHEPVNNKNYQGAYNHQDNDSTD
jgi:hypothetical protein